MYFCQLFLIPIKWFQQCGEDKHFSSTRSGFESLSGHKILIWFHWHLSQTPIVPMAQWVPQQASEALGTGSNLNLYPHFNFINATEKTWYSPTVIQKIFRNPKFSETQKGFSTDCFGCVRQKKFRQKIWKTEVLPFKCFQLCETKIFRQKIVAPTRLHKI